MRGIFRSDAIPRRKRIEVLKTLVLSKVLYNSGTWPSLHPLDVAELSKPIVRVLRLIGRYEYVPGCETQNFISDREVFKAMQFPPVEVFVAASRLRFWRRFLTQAKPGLRALAQNTVHIEGSWASAVKSDLCLLQLASPKLDDLIDPREDPSQWENIALDHKAAWKGILDSVSSSLALFVVSSCTQTEPEAVIAAHACEDCQKVF